MAPKAKPKRTQPDDGDDDDDDGAVTFTDEQRTEITNLVNAAVSGQLQRKLPNAIKSTLDSSLAPVMERLEQLGTGRRGADDDDDADDDDETTVRPKGKGKAPARGGKPDPEVATLRKQVATMAQERAQEREQARNRDRDGQLRDHLAKSGVDPNRIRGAIAVLRESTKYDEKAGEWYYTTKRDGLDEDIDIAAGVSEWSKTDEGKSYLAPAQQGPNRTGPGLRGGAAPVLGSGGGAGGQPRGADAKAQKQAAKSEAFKNLTGAIDSLAGGNVPLG